MPVTVCLHQIPGERETLRTACLCVCVCAQARVCVLNFDRGKEGAAERNHVPWGGTEGYARACE